MAPKGVRLMSSALRHIENSLENSGPFESKGFSGPMFVHNAGIRRLRIRKHQSGIPSGEKTPHRQKKHTKNGSYYASGLDQFVDRAAV
jgi:hypothetical protein